MHQTTVRTLSSRLRIGHVRIDITPPEGIYHGLWGAAPAHRATGVHKPIYADVLALCALDEKAQPLIQIFLDHAGLEDERCEHMRARVSRATGVPLERVILSFSHTHATGLMSEDRRGFPGGDLIAPYLATLERQLEEAASESVAGLRAVTISYAHGRCAMAANRDYRDGEQFACGFNPATPADGIVLVGRITDARDALAGTLVHYGCHPTTLAWQNRMVSPDYVGAAREVVERHTGAPCVFIQGACGDLGPRYGFVGDTGVADQNGRWLGFSALAALESLGPPGHDYHYAGAVVSGATLGTWEHRRHAPERAAAAARMEGGAFEVRLPVKAGPDKAARRAEMDALLSRQQQAKASGDDLAARDCGARAERARRWLQRLGSLADPCEYRYPCSVYRLGDAIWIAAGGEPSASIQSELRRRLPDHAVIFCPLSGAHAVGYLLPEDRYGIGLYQEEAALLAAGSLERLTEAILGRVASLL